MEIEKNNYPPISGDKRIKLALVKIHLKPLKLDIIKNKRRKPKLRDLPNNNAELTRTEI